MQVECLTVYKNLNKFIYDEFFGKKIRTKIVFMTIDEFKMEEFLRSSNLTQKDLEKCISRLFADNWEDVIKKDNDIPLMFGLISIQIFVAYKMHKDNEYTENAYNPRLAGYLKIDEQTLQKLYSKYQDKLWAYLKEWTKANGYDVNIAEPSCNTRRYVKYPLMHSLLNIEDLNRIPYFFEQRGISLYKRIEFEEFECLVRYPDPRSNLSKHFYKLQEKLYKEGMPELLLKQMYAYYLNKWGGEYPSEPIKEKKHENKDHSKNRDTTQKANITLIVDDGFTEMKILDAEYNTIEAIALLDKDFFFKVKKYYQLKESVLFFTKDEDCNEWKNNKYLDFQENLIICQKRSKYSEGYSSFEIYSNSCLDIIKIRIDDIEMFPKWYETNGRIKPYKLKNGIKLDRKTWMNNVGPAIDFVKPMTVWINGEKKEISESNLTLSLRNYPPGSYILTVPDFFPEEIIIKDTLMDVISYPQGWHFNREKHLWHPIENDSFISGLSINPNMYKSLTPTRAWIDTVLNKKET